METNAMIDELTYGNAANYFEAEESFPLPPNDWLSKDERRWRSFYKNMKLHLQTTIWPQAGSMREFKVAMLAADFEIMQVVKHQLSARYGNGNLDLAYRLEDHPDEFAHFGDQGYAKVRAGFAGGFLLLNPGSELARVGPSQREDLQRTKALEALKISAYEKTRFIFKLKAEVNRPRPFQAAGYVPTASKKFAAYVSNTAWTASLPSGHCFEALAAATAAYLTHDLQSDRRNLCQWAARAGDVRVWAGLHFPSDSLASFYLALTTLPKLYTMQQLSDARAFTADAITESETFLAARRAVAEHQNHPYAAILHSIELALKHT